MGTKAEIRELILERLTRIDFNLPVFDKVALQLMAAVQRDGSSADELGQIINQDPSMASEVLRIANSAFYSGASEIATVRNAIIRLGLKKIISITMLASQQEVYSDAAPHFFLIMGALWKHSNVAAFGCEWLATRAGRKRMADEAFMAGLLHDIGKLAILTTMEKLIEEQQLEANQDDDVVLELLLEEHAAIGAQLLAHWNLPETYQEVIAGHEAEDFDNENSLLAIVRLVNKACWEIGISVNRRLDMHLSETEEAKVLKLDSAAIEELIEMLNDVETEF